MKTLDIEKVPDVFLIFLSNQKLYRTSVTSTKLSTFWKRTFVTLVFWLSLIPRDLSVENNTHLAAHLPYHIFSSLAYCARQFKALDTSNNTKTALSETSTVQNRITLLLRNSKKVLI